MSKVIAATTFSFSLVFPVTFDCADADIAPTRTRTFVAFVLVLIPPFHNSPFRRANIHPPSTA